MTADLMPTEMFVENRREGTAHFSIKKVRCKLCGTETKGGHPLTVCVFALMKRVEKLEGRKA